MMPRIEHNDETNMCNTVNRVIYPQAGRTHNGKLLFIVNQGPYRQGVRIELCLQPKKPCRMSENFPLGYTTSCKQLFSYHYLISLDENGAAVRDVFKFPVCCKCYFERRL
jgi:Spaetzle